MALSVIFPALSQYITTDKIANHCFGLAGNRHFVLNVSYFSVQPVSGQLAVKVNSGIAIVGGYYVEETSTSTISVPSNTTSYLYVQIVTDANNRATHAQYVVSTNANLEDRKTMLLAQIVAGSSSINSIVDRRTLFGTINFISAYYIETSTSTTLTFNKAKGIYAIFEGIGAGGGSAVYNGTLNGEGATGGSGGGYSRNEGYIPNCNVVQIQIGAGTAGDGGTTYVYFKDTAGNTLMSFSAPGGKRGFRINSSGSYGNLEQSYNFYDIGGNFSTNSNYCWSFSNSINEHITIFSRKITINAGSFFGGSFTTFYGGGTGYSFIRGGSSTGPQPSAIYWGGGGGFINSAGQAPGGGGGASTLSSGDTMPGANGAVRLYLLVFI